MSLAFRPAIRENVNLILGFAGASGAGKTYTAMRVATGIAGGKRFAVIDTENGRAGHYADQFAFDVADLAPPFTPARYAEAIQAADDAGYPVVLVDSMSHEWAGHGGILDMQEDEFERLGHRDAAKMLSWAKPKREHKAMMQTLLRTRAHLILCFRAEAKIDMVKDDKGKLVIVPKASLTGLDGWIPITEKTVPFELTASFLLTPDAPGVPKPIKLQEQHRALFPLDKPITEEAGKGVAAWAAGGTVPRATGAPPNFATRIAACKTMGDLLAVKTAMNAARSTMNATEKETLRKAAVEQEAKLSPADAPTSAITYAHVAQAIANATTDDGLALARDLIRSVPDGDLRAELDTLANERAMAMAMEK